MGPANNKLTAMSARRATRSIKGGSVVSLSSIQIEDARHYLSDNLTQVDLNPTNLAQGGRERVIALLRQGAADGKIRDIPRNPSDSTLRALYNNTVGLGVLEEFLANPNVEQINVQAPDKIVLQVNGIWTEVTDPDLLFEDTKELRMVASNIARRVGKELSRHTTPIMDIRFESPVLRIHINQTRRDYGISLYIRRGRSEPFSTDFLLEKGNFNREVLEIMQGAAQRLIGCIFLGAVGSGKTVMLEKYIDFMPNVPIVVVDDAGDCQPSHSMCAVFDLPETTYVGREMGITLGGMTRAALREGDVLVVAETRGAEEAGILISDAPSMRCVVSTAHGDSASSGLSRLVSIAQRPPSPYAGTNSLDALRRDLSNAFPLVVHVDRRGDRRFISGIYHNLGWSEEKRDWNLRTIVAASVGSDSSITWEIVDGDLDKVKQFVGLDRMQTGRLAIYESRNPQRMLAEALARFDESKWVEAIHLLSQILKDDPSNDIVRQRLIFSMEQTGDAEVAKEAAYEVIKEMDNLITERNWSEVRRIFKDLPNRPTAYAYVWRLHPNLNNARQLIEQGYQEQQRAEYVIQEANEMMTSQLGWTEFKRCLTSLKSLDTYLLTDQNKEVIKELHTQLLVILVERSPHGNAQFYRQQLEDFVGKTEAQARLAKKEQEDV